MNALKPQIRFSLAHAAVPRQKYKKLFGENT